MAAPWFGNFLRGSACEEAYTRPLALTIITFVLSVSTIARKTKRSPMLYHLDVHTLDDSRDVAHFLEIKSFHN